MRKFKLLDLFCGAGGATKGYQRAGFYVVGVDIKPQPHYCGDEFYQADALEFPLEGYDAYHASPPCQRFSSLKTKWNSRDAPDLLTPTLIRFDKYKLWVVENVVGSPLPSHVQLCGSVFNLGSHGYQLRRHRWFQSNILIPVPSCNHKGRAISVVGGVKINRLKTRVPLEWGKEAMGIAWMTWEELSQAIPPAYTEYIGKYLLKVLEAPTVREK